MPLYELLAEDDKSNRRTVMDALEVLRTKAKFEQDDVAKIQLGRLKLPSNQQVSLILISFESTIHQKTLFRYRQQTVFVQSLKIFLRPRNTK